MLTGRWFSPGTQHGVAHQEIQQRPEMVALLFLNCWKIENTPGQTSKHTRAPALPACCWLLGVPKYLQLYYGNSFTILCIYQIDYFIFFLQLSYLTSWVPSADRCIIWKVYNDPIGEMCHYFPIFPKYSSKKKATKKCIFRYHWVTCWEQAAFWHRDTSVKMWKWSDSLE